MNRWANVAIVLSLCQTLTGAHAGAGEAVGDPQIGKALPTVSLPSSDGKDVKLPQDLKGKWTLLYFYPKDNSPGCTTQASDYRDNLQGFKKRAIQVYGISADSVASHKNFINTVNINFPLLADENHKLSKALGVFDGDLMSRDTFLVDPKGVIQVVWRKVNPSSTTAETYESALKHVRSSAAP